MPSLLLLYSFLSNSFYKQSFSLPFVMFDTYIRIFYSFQLYLLMIVLIKQKTISTLPTSNNNNMDISDKTIRLVSDKAWVKVSMNPGKDKSNAYQLRNTRGNIMKTVIMIISGVFILFFIGGIISIIIYYVKKHKLNNSNSISIQ